MDLPPGAEALFTSLGIKTMILRSVPCAPFGNMVLVRANFQLKDDYLVALPNLKNSYQQNFWGKNKSPGERAWWLANRFLLNKGRSDASILFLGTSIMQPERKQSGSLVNFATYHDSILEILKASPNFFYSSPLPMDHSELRFMKQLGATCPSLPIAQLLASDEFDFLVSLDSAYVPVARAFNKKITILGSQPTWSTLPVRQFDCKQLLAELIMIRSLAWP